MSAWPDDQNDETPGVCVFSPNSLLLGFYLTKKSWPHSLAAPLNSVAGLCGWVPWLGSVSRPCPPLVLCGWALFCVQALSLVLCGWALCPGLVLLLAAPLNLAGLCVQALSSSCPLWLGLFLFLSLSWLRPRTLWLVSVARFTGEECGRTNSDVNADKNSLMKQFALGVKVGRSKKSIFD